MKYELKNKNPFQDYSVLSWGESYVNDTTRYCSAHGCVYSSMSTEGVVPSSSLADVMACR